MSLHSVILPLKHQLIEVSFDRFSRTIVNNVLFVGVNNKGEIHTLKHGVTLDMIKGKISLWCIRKDLIPIISTKELLSVQFMYLNLNHSGYSYGSSVSALTCVREYMGDRNYFVCRKRYVNRDAV